MDQIDAVKGDTLNMFKKEMQLSWIPREGCFEAFGEHQHVAGPSPPVRNPAKESL